MRAVAEGSLPAHIFHRSADRSPFPYAGRAKAADIQNTTPVIVRWSFATAPAKETAIKLSKEAVCEELEALGFNLAAAGVKPLFSLILYRF
jgi:putative restriction endonuclease